MYYKKLLFLILFSIIIITLSCSKEKENIATSDKVELISPYQNCVLPCTVGILWEYVDAHIYFPYSQANINFEPVYEVFIWEEETDELVHYDVVYSNSAHMRNIENHKSYKWQVIANLTEDISIESDIWHFSTDFE